MGRALNAEPVDVVVHDGAVIITGFGKHHLVLSPQAAEHLASRLSGAAFTASCSRRSEVEEGVSRMGVRSKTQPRFELEAPFVSPIFASRGVDAGR